jgi:hypothetical protein
MMNGYDEVEEGGGIDQQEEEDDLVFSTPENFGGGIENIRIFGRYFNRKKFITVSALFGIAFAVILGVILTLVLAHPTPPLSSESVFMTTLIPLLLLFLSIPSVVCLFTFLLFLHLLLLLLSSSFLILVLPYSTVLNKCFFKELHQR